MVIWINKSIYKKGDVNMEVIYPDYKNSILNVSHTILDFYNVKPLYPVIRELKEELNTSIKHVCLMLLDGMGINIIEKHLNKNSFIRRNLKKKITSVFPATTVAATNTVLTANPPFVSGYLGWVQYFGEIDSNLVVFQNHDYYDNDKTFSVDYRNKYLKQNLIFDYIKTSRPDVETYELFPDFRQAGFKTFESQIKRLKEITNKDEDNFTYIYWTQPDELQHQVGINNLLVKAKLEALNNELETFASTMNEDTILIVIADHGLVNVEGIDLYKNKDLMDILIRKPSIEPRATNFFVKPLFIEKFRILFNKTYGKYYKLLSKQELYESELLGSGVIHPMLDSFLGDYLAISISNKFFKFKERVSYKGHHAGLTKGEMEVPLIIYKKR